MIFSPFIEISSISIEGNREISSIEIKNSLENLFSEKYFGVFPKGSFFLVNQKGISGAIRNVSNRLQVISVEKRFPASVKVKLNELKAEIAWCSGGVCYFVDKGGLVYAGSNMSEEDLCNSGFLVLVDDSAQPVDKGKKMIDSDFIQFLEDTAKLVIDDLGLQIAGSFHTPGESSSEASVPVAEGWILKISSEYPKNEAKKIIQTLFERDLNEETRKNLEYLDLTVKNKIYYKFRSEESGDDEKTEDQSEKAKG